MKYILLLLVSCLSFQNTLSQDYTKIDEIVDNYPIKFKSIKQLAGIINKDFNTDLEKTRAAYYWICNNISYDYKSYNSGKNNYESIKISYKSSQKDVFALEKKYAQQVLKKKTGVCEGYAQLLKFVLNELNIECYVISGFTKRNVSEIGKIRNDSNHAWNGVNIEGEWKLIDATWSTGNTEKTPKSFNFNDTYFFISPEKMILNHLPKYPKWQLLDKPISKQDFFLQPFFYSKYFKSNLILNKKNIGILKVKQNDTITLSFKSIDDNKFFYYEFKEDKYSAPLVLEKLGDEYISKIIFPYNRNTTLTLFDQYSIIDYKVILER